MQNAVLIMYAIYPFQKHKFTPLCGILIERDWIGFSYMFISDLTKKTNNKHYNIILIEKRNMGTKVKKTKLERQTQAELCFCMQHCMRNFIPLFHQGSSSAGSEPEPSFKPVLCLSTPKAPAPNQEKRFVGSTKTLLG